jgi:hypothetical protein
VPGICARAHLERRARQKPGPCALAAVPVGELRALQRRPPRIDLKCKPLLCMSRRRYLMRSLHSQPASAKAEPVRLSQSDRQRERGRRPRHADHPSQGGHLLRHDERAEPFGVRLTVLADRERIAALGSEEAEGSPTTPRRAPLPSAHARSGAACNGTTLVCAPLRVPTGSQPEAYARLKRRTARGAKPRRP